jgi:hypothetical protein
LASTELRVTDHAQVAVTLTVAPTLEERIVDWLLARQDVETFTGYTTYGHGGERDLSVAEQVSGRRRRVELRVELAAEALDEWLAALGERFSGADVGYFVAPILRSGHLRRSVS